MPCLKERGVFALPTEGDGKIPNRIEPCSLPVKHLSFVAVNSPFIRHLLTRRTGNCLYYSLSDQLWGSFDHDDEIRQLLADHMESNKKYFMQFVAAEGGERRRPKRAAQSAYATRSADVSAPSEEDKKRRFEEMVTSTRKQGEWGSSEHLQAFCQVFKVDINVYTMDGVQAFRDVYATPEEHRDVIHVAFHV
jgi:hypothetical protein